MKNVAIVLSAGVGKRMNTNIPKQYLDLCGKPVIYYALKAFQDSFMDEIVLVCGKDDIDYCRKEIVEKYDLTKVTKIVPGGKERYHSVGNGLKAINDADYVYVHDGARPFVDDKIINNAFECVKKTDACIVGVAVKDTIKVIAEDGAVIDTPPRKSLFQVQTPQAFSYELLMDTYKLLAEREEELLQQGISITDDAMLIENLSKKKVYIAEGSYTNIKITTNEDMIFARSIIEGK